MKKVYCKDCELVERRYFKINGYIEHSELRCRYAHLHTVKYEPPNKDGVIETSEWRSPIKNNKCKYYKRKWWKFWV